ncbi:MAG: GNAT family N-acetyltransferase [Acidobacteriota bacterium]|nr:GNAT family N-acetyltransferase [Acidobacteriota bacterium]
MEQKPFEMPKPCSRFSLRPFRSDDLDDLHRLFTDPGIRRYLFDDVELPRSQTEEILAESARLFAEKGFGLWAPAEHRTSRILGFCGYWFFFEPPELQLLYGIDPAFWGRGYAAEAAAELIRYGHEQLDMDRIIAATDVPNTASIKVMEKLGMVFHKRAVVDGKDTVWYRHDRN